MKIQFLTEESLIAECIKENIHAQRELYGRYAQKLFAVGYRYTDNMMQAEDLLQESFIAIFEHIKDYRREDSFETWMKRMVIRTAFCNYRKKNYPPVSINDEEHDIEILCEETPFTTFSGKEITELIRKIPIEYRQVLNLHAIDGFSHKEIAKILRISEGNSEIRLYRARNILKKIMVEDYLRELNNLDLRVKRQPADVATKQRTNEKIYF